MDEVNLIPYQLLCVIYDCKTIFEGTVAELTDLAPVKLARYDVSGIYVEMDRVLTVTIK